MDMSQSFKPAVQQALGKPIIVADRFHFVRYKYWVLDGVRSRIRGIYYRHSSLYFQHSLVYYQLQHYTFHLNFSIQYVRI
jgi:transposase